ncbi:UDP-N-acetylglucosamine 4-epimerase [bioreactor metagenome]|uniref:UDP-N-acetylglucosamine 4-epimerase n=1 Tax=bioreactor metagenome TaxID=1076179 RepID=A0A644Y7H4_9ZZZZ
MIEKTVEHSRILVTGGAGFIGSNLVEALLALGNEVVALDNFSTGKRENLAPFAANRAFTLVEGDIRDFAACRRAATGVEFVLHEAALGSVPRSLKDPITMTEVNVSGFVNVLFAAYEAGAKRVAYASSSSVYGDNSTLPKVEERIGHQLSPYAVTKYADELFAENFGRVYGMEMIGLRYFNVYGPRQDTEGPYAAVIPKFAMSLIRHESPVIHGNGLHSRDFTYVDDVVQANQLALLADSTEAVNTVYNIAYGERTTLNEVFGALRENLAGFDPEIAKIEPQYGPPRAGDIPHSLADIGKAKKFLGYIPRFGIENGLRNAMTWYFDHLRTGRVQ